MNIIKRLISGGKEKKKDSREADPEEHVYEREHCEVDFDKQFEQAQARRSTSSSVPPIVQQQCEYRSSPTPRGTPTSRSKSPSPFAGQPSQLQHPQQHLIKQYSQAKKNSLGTPSTVRKCSEPNWKTKSRQKSPQDVVEKDKVKRNLTDSQKRKAKEIVESISWIQPAAPEVCYASTPSVRPQIVQSQMIVPQIHICEALPIARPGKAVAIIPAGAAAGKVVTGFNRT